MSSSPQPHAIEVVYRLRVPVERATELARAIAYEQTVELPEALVTDRRILRDVVGEVASVAPDPRSDGHSLVQIRFNPELASGQLPQLLNLIYGNVSIYPGVRLVDLRLPPAFLAELEGPAFGIEGVRRLVGVWDRPLLATALKPRGTPLEEFCRQARQFAEGGGDLIKDDQNLVPASYEEFREHVMAVAGAVEGANQRSGRRCLYFPHVSAPLSEMDRRLELVHRLDLKGVLLCPMILGLDTVRTLSRRWSMVLMAHPALTGSYTGGVDGGIAHEILLGMLFRMAGADISIFPNHGGRFSFTPEECRALRDRLREPLGVLRPAFPAPAGGMLFENLPAMGTDYGADAVFLVGGALLGHGEDLAEGTRAFRERIQEQFSERRTSPQEQVLSACELPGQTLDRQADPVTLGRLLYHLSFREGFRWEGRESSAYKAGQNLPFQGIRRVELLGKHGEKTAFDLRYFEVAPGGFTSLERHVHTHVIIVVRGDGVLHANDDDTRLAPLDIAYVEPLQVHQLRNEGREPFGFFCLVDHDRDRPMKP